MVEMFSSLLLSVSGPLLAMKQSFDVPLGSWVSPSASCIFGLLSVGVLLMKIKPLRITNYKIKFSNCWQLKCCHMLFLLHHWKSGLSVPKRHIMLFVFCYPSGKQIIIWTPSNRVQQAPGRGCAAISFCHSKGVLQTLFGHHCFIMELRLNGKSEPGPVSWMAQWRLVIY